MAGYLEDNQGNKSSSRLSLFIVLIYTLVLITYNAYKCTGPITFSDSFITLVEILLGIVFFHTAIQKYFDLKFGDKK